MSFRKTNPKWQTYFAITYFQQHLVMKCRALRCIVYNMHRLTNLIIILMVSTEPDEIYFSTRKTAVHVLE